MKVLITLLLLVPVLQVSAKKLELGANSGLSFQREAYSHKRYCSYSISARASCRLSKHFEAGISGGSLRMSFYNYGVTLLYYPTFSDKTNYTQIVDVYSVKAFSNYLYHFKRQTVYAGLSGGYAAPILPNEHFLRLKQPNDGYIIGMQAGVTCYVTKHIGVNAESRIERIRLQARQDQDYNPDNNKTSLTEWVFPVTIGVRFIL